MDIQQTTEIKEGVRCPHCRKTFSVWLTVEEAESEERYAECPHCDASFDEREWEKVK